MSKKKIFDVKKPKDILVLVLLVYTIAAIIALIAYFMLGSSEYATHMQLIGVIGVMGSSMLSGFLATWLKLIDIAVTVGEIKGTLSQFIRNRQTIKTKQ